MFADEVPPVRRQESLLVIETKSDHKWTSTPGDDWYPRECPSSLSDLLARQTDTERHKYNSGTLAWLVVIQSGKTAIHSGLYKKGNGHTPKHYSFGTGEPGWIPVEIQKDSSDIDIRFAWSGSGLMHCQFLQPSAIESEWDTPLDGKRPMQLVVNTIGQTSLSSAAFDPERILWDDAERNSRGSLEDFLKEAVVN